MELWTSALLKTEADYQATLAEIEGLCDAMPNTPAEYHPDALAAVVDAYEAQCYSLPALDPNEAIASHMESRGLSRRDLAPYLGGVHGWWKCSTVYIPCHST
jgi:HTH-type transcriptional regulator/antitoxin HigA